MNLRRKRSQRWKTLAHRLIEAISIRSRSSSRLPSKRSCCNKWSRLVSSRMWCLPPKELLSMARWRRLHSLKQLLETTLPRWQGAFRINTRRTQPKDTSKRCVTLRNTSWARTSIACLMSIQANKAKIQTKTQRPFINTALTNLYPKSKVHRCQSTLLLRLRIWRIST